MYTEYSTLKDLGSIRVLGIFDNLIHLMELYKGLSSIEGRTIISGILNPDTLGIIPTELLIQLSIFSSNDLEIKVENEYFDYKLSLNYKGYKFETFEDEETLQEWLMYYNLTNKYNLEEVK